MLTLFACPKPFKDLIKTIQWNAIASWTLLTPKPAIILFGNEEGTKEICQALDLHWIPDISRNEFGTPLVSDLFERAQQLATTSVMGYINADIILMNNFMKAVKQVEFLNKQFLMVGQRLDLDIDSPLGFQPGWEAKLRLDAETKGRLHAPTGIDYFIFKRGFIQNMPPLAIGRTAWDNWFLYYTRVHRASLIDATHDITAIHQNHDYAHHPGGARAVWNGQEAQRNQRLVKYVPRFFSLRDSSHRLVKGRLERNILGSVWFYAAKEMIKERRDTYTRPFKQALKTILQLISDYNTRRRIIFGQSAAFTDTPGLYSNFQTMKRVLVIAPHPDDEAIGCGGTLFQLKQKNPTAEIKILILTDGAASDRMKQTDIREIRKQESCEFAEKLGLSEQNLTFFDYPDGALSVTQASVERLVNLLKAFSPTDVFVPYPADSHPDHFAAAQLLSQALQWYPKETHCWSYEVWTPLPPNRLLDISSVMAKKMEGIQGFKSQQDNLDYAGKIQALNHYRSMLAPKEVTHAEAFFVCGTRDFIELTQQLNFA